MSYEYMGQVSLSPQDAIALIKGILAKMENVTVVHEGDTTLNVIYPNNIDRQEDAWAEDAQFVAAQDTIGVVIHSATRGDRETLIKTVERGFRKEGIILFLEED